MRCKVEGRGINQYKGECSGSIAHFVSNVDLFFILFNNKLSTICPKLVRLGVLSWGGGRGEGRWWIMRESMDRSIKMEREGKDGGGRGGEGGGREEGGGRRVWEVNNERTRTWQRKRGLFDAPCVQIRRRIYSRISGSEERWYRRTCYMYV